MKMKCLYKTKKGIPCAHDALQYSKWCSRKSHYPSLSEYTTCMKKLQQEWEANTLPNQQWKRYNPPDDGWCFFNAALHSLREIVQERQEEKEDELFRFATAHPNYFFNYTPVTSVILEALQKKIANWILTHLDERYKATGETVKELLLSSHELDSIEEYKREMEKKETVLSRQNWGTTCEHYALARLFQVNIFVFSPVRFSRDKKGILREQMGKVVRKTTRYKLLSVIQGRKEYFPIVSSTTCAKNGLYLLLFFLRDKRGRDLSHYNSLLLKKR